MIVSSSSTTLIQELYSRMLLTRLVDECAWKLYRQGHLHTMTSSRGHEAAQVGSALCIEVGKDFTLPYYRDLGVVLTIGMTPYEVLRTYLQLAQAGSSAPEEEHKAPLLHWGYHKHNTVTGTAPVATQILHAAGIAFASKLRKTDAVTVAYCGDSATSEADFAEGVRFAAQHQLPVIIICEQDTPLNTATTATETGESKQHTTLELPEGLCFQQIDGSDVLAVHEAMKAALAYARTGKGPVLLEIIVTRLGPPAPYSEQEPEQYATDPLWRCQQYMQHHDMWDADWATHLHDRLLAELSSTLQAVLHESSSD